MSSSRVRSRLPILRSERLLSDVHCLRPMASSAFDAGFADTKSLFTPETLDSLVVDLPSLVAQQLGCLLVSPPAVLARERSKTSTQSLFEAVRLGLPRALRGPWLSEHPTSSSLGDFELLDEGLSSPSLSLRAHHFPSAISLSIPCRVLPRQPTSSVGRSRVRAL